MDYSTYTVKELKEMVKTRSISIYVNGTKKADYIKALQDDDSYQQSTQNFHNSLNSFKQEMEDKTKYINESITKIRESVIKIDEKVSELKNKTHLSIDDYKLIVDLLEKRIKLMKDW